MSKKTKPEPKPVTLPTPDEQAALPPEEEEGLPSLEGMVFSPYLDPADLDGTNWNLSRNLPEMPVIDWDDPPMPDEFKPGIDPESFQSEPEPVAALFEKADSPEKLDPFEKLDFFEKTDLPPEPDQPRRPAMDWLQPAEKIAEKITPLGRPALRPPHPSLYGNLADSTWITKDRPTIVDAGEEDLSDQIPLRVAAVPAATSPSEVVKPPSPAQTLLQIAPLRVQELPYPLQPDQGKPTAVQLMLPAPAHAQPLTVIEELPATPLSAREGAGDEIDPLLFRSFYERERKAPDKIRIPHLGHVGILGLLACLGLVGAGLLTRAAISLHLFGVTTVQAAMADVHYTIGSMAALYLIAFGAALLVFPLVWHKGYFAGVQWNLSSARRHVWSLLAAAGVCFVLALVDEVALPGPANAPIDKLFDSRAAAWLLFAFGVTFAPFFEETIFRGFLLPALCTAFDWSVERATGNPARPLDPNGHPQWSLGAMVFAAITTSVPFALMHAEQTAWSLGPFLLLVAVSLVLSWARLSARSLAASVLVHASYNFLLFSLMLLGTGGFRHLDKM